LFIRWVTRGPSLEHAITTEKKKGRWKIEGKTTQGLTVDIKTGMFREKQRGDIQLKLIRGQEKSAWEGTN